MNRPVRRPRLPWRAGAVAATVGSMATSAEVFVGLNMASPPNWMHAALWLSVAFSATGVVLPPAAWILFRLRGRLRGFSASSLTDLAVLLAGSRRPALRAEWHAHLAGESGHDPATWTKVTQALGFVASAVRFRLADAADQAWRPVDAVLGSRTLSNLFVWGPVIVTLFAIVHHDGRFGLVADVQVARRPRRLPLRRDQDRALVAESQAARAQGQARQGVRGRPRGRRAAPGGERRTPRSPNHATGPDRGP